MHACRTQLPAAAGSGCRQATATAPTMRSIGVPLVVSAILPSAAIAVAPCPAGMTLMAEAVPWRGDTFTVCETAEPGGAHAAPPPPADQARAAVVGGARRARDGARGHGRVDDGRGCLHGRLIFEALEVIQICQPEDRFPHATALERPGGSTYLPTSVPNECSA